MINTHEYIFGFPKGIAPALQNTRDILWARETINKLLSKILPSDQMRERRNNQLFQQAISSTVDEIFEKSYF